MKDSIFGNIIPKIWGDFIIWSSVALPRETRQFSPQILNILLFRWKSMSYSGACHWASNQNITSIFLYNNLKYFIFQNVFTELKNIDYNQRYFWSKMNFSTQNPQVSQGKVIEPPIVIACQIFDTIFLHKVSFKSF